MTDPTRITVFGDSVQGDKVAGNVTHHHGPVFHGAASGNQFGWENRTVTQTQSGQDVAAVIEAVGRIVATVGQVGLPDERAQEVEDAGAEVLDTSDDDPTAFGRALGALRRLLLPIATGVTTGAADGAQEWAREAVAAIGG
jgi:hypothetical protein